MIVVYSIEMTDKTYDISRLSICWIASRSMMSCSFSQPPRFGTQSCTSHAGRAVSSRLSRVSPGSSASRPQLESLRSTVCDIVHDL